MKTEIRPRTDKAELISQERSSDGNGSDARVT